MKQFIQKVEPIPFTKDGFEKIQKEQEQLLVERVDALTHLKKSREMGDLKENGYYQASRQKMNAIDGRLRRIKFLLKYGVVLSPSQSGMVEIGSTVTLKTGNNEVTYQIVGGEESNPSEGRISHRSPLGKALFSHKTGEKITLNLPAGSTDYLIKKIS
ncbi:MAG: GreA/GreB family elongation factor [Patescibacteria group bacterium]